MNVRANKITQHGGTSVILKFSLNGSEWKTAMPDCSESTKCVECETVTKIRFKNEIMQLKIPYSVIKSCVSFACNNKQIYVYNSKTATE